MSDKTAVERLNELFCLELDHAPDELERKLLSPYFKKLMDNLRYEVDQLWQIINSIVTSEPDSNEKLREALMQLSNRRAQVVGNENKLHEMEEVLKEFGFTNILPASTTPPTP
jgi:hypothetical protein